MLHIVLYQPEIPENTGNIIRTAMASNSIVHLIKPYGFILNEKHLKRAGMDYIDLATIKEYVSFDEFYKEVKDSDHVYYLTRYGHKTPKEFDYKAVSGDIYLVFGKESTGIDKVILKDHIEDCIRIPMASNARSLNLANTVAIMVYEVLGQLGYPNLSSVEVQKGATFLENYNTD